jgi:hypothetical protein
METTKNKLSENAEIFFQELSSYLETPLYFYGSIQRNDYFPGHSDIDVDIFTSNESSVIAKMQHFLHVKQSDFKKFVWRLNHNNQVVYGYKIFYISPKKDFQVEFAIYNEKYKKGVLKEHLKKTVLPFYAIWLLTILKCFYYQLHLIDKSTFTYIKKIIMTHGIGLPHDDFIVLK